jgi:hypothetical protein
VTRALVRLFIEHRFISNDGSRRVIADGHAGRQSAEVIAADDALMAEVAGAMREIPGEDVARDAGRAAWLARQQRGGGAS